MSVCVFDNPEHANGGCIFADPSQPLVISDVVTGGGENKRHRIHLPERHHNYALALRDDEEILVALQAWFVSKHKH